jgi:hypothetical protein
MLGNIASIPVVVRRVVEPTEALNMAEASLRHLMHEILGCQWLSVQGAPKPELLQQRLESAQASHTGRRVSHNLLDYTYIKELQTLYRQEHRRFGEVFRDKKTFEALLQLLVDYRNTPHHANPLMPYEADLVSGAAGYITNHITRWRNERDDLGSYYPTILSVVDNFGTVLTQSGWKSNPKHSGDYLYGPNLDVGQTVAFTCTGSHPRGRTLTWALSPGELNEYHFSPDRAVVTAEGESAVLEWRVEDHDVSPSRPVLIHLIAQSRHHRWNGCDDGRVIRYFVRPPLD